MFKRIEAFLNKANSREIVETAQQTQSSIQSEDVNADQEYRIIDENHPVELFRLLDDPTRETCASEVKQSIQIAATVFHESGIPFQGILAYYLTDDTKQIINHLELRHVPTHIAWQIVESLQARGLGSMIAINPEDNEAIVGLPTGINRYKCVPVINGKSRNPLKKLLSGIRALSPSAEGSKKDLVG